MNFHDKYLPVFLFSASTNMNDQSSRSHAIFTLYIQQQRQAKQDNNPFHLELDEADAENSAKKVDILAKVVDKVEGNPTVSSL